MRCILLFVCGALAAFLGWFLEAYSAELGKSIGKWNIIFYIVAVLMVIVGVIEIVLEIIEAIGSRRRSSKRTRASGTLYTPPKLKRPGTPAKLKRPGTPAKRTGNSKPPRPTGSKKAGR